MTLDLWITLCAIVAIFFWFVGYLSGKADQEEINKAELKRLIDKTRYGVEKLRR